ncbi:unnamed protein product [Schistosoma turkestanicum]|nr:unnamed protein product [Schistosoma turkestanicum]
MIDSNSMDLFNSLSPIKSRSSENKKFQYCTFGKELNSIDQQLVTSSVASSGYWEDCDSLATSEYDVFGLNWATSHQNDRIKYNKLKHRPHSDGTGQSLVRTQSFHLKQKVNIDGNSTDPYTVEHHSDSILNSYGKDLQFVTNSQNTQVDNTQPLPLEDHNHPCKSNDSVDETGLTKSDFRLCQKNYSSVHNNHFFQSIPSGVQNVEEKTFKFIHEWDDSEDEEVVEGAEPKTKFEAALRRAEEKNQKRKALMMTSKEFPTSGKVMPEWGSPIQIKKNINQNRFMECSLSVDIPLSNTSSPKISRPSDLCREVEEWLESRPSWIDQKHQKNNTALQICFLNTSEQSLYSSMEAIVTEPQLDNRNNAIEQNDTEVNLFPTINSIRTADNIDTRNSVDDNEIVMNNNIEDFDDNSNQLAVYGNSCHKNGRNRMNSSISGRSSLLLAFESSVNFIALLDEINMYYERLLDQCRQECFNARSVLYVQELIKNHKRFQMETQIAIIQVPKMSAMQAEVERMKIPSITPNLATLLRVDLKKFQICKEELIKLSKSQLEVIMNDIHSKIENLNNALMLSLVERDDLHLEQGGKIIALEDIKSWIKELSLRSSIPQVRQQLVLNFPSNLTSHSYNADDLSPKSQTTCQSLSKRPQWMKSLFSRGSHRHALSL